MSAVIGALTAGVAVFLVARPGDQAARRLRPAPTALRAVALRRHGTRRSDRQLDGEVVTLCASLAAELRAGLPPAAALSSAAGELSVLGPRLARAAHAVSRGALLGQELAAAGVAERCHRLAVVAAVCAAGEATGAGVADALDRVGRGLASDDEAAAEMAALAAGPRATAVVLAGLPVVAVGLGGALGLAPLRILFHTVLGVALLVGAALLEVTGFLWVRRITAAALNR